MRITHNVMALNSWRNLNVNNDNLSKSLEKLSSGYRINRAGDDPAGLVISEKLRAEITGVGQAVNNTQDAVSMVQVAEGALVEINTMLNSMRALALHAANTGASSTDAITADQQQIDSAVDSIASIASNTSYLGRYLINGNSGNTATVLSAKVASVTVGTTAPTGTNTFTASVTTAASGASAYGSGAATAAGAATGGSLVINGVSITIATGVSAGSAAVLINAAFVTANMTTLSAAAGSASALFINNSTVGSSNTVNIIDANGTFFTAGEAKLYKGTDIGGTINGEAAVGSGLMLTAATGTTYANTVVTVNAQNGGNAVGTLGNTAQVKNNSVVFQIGANASERQTVSLANVNPNQLGVNAVAGTSGLYDIKTGGNYTLSKDAASALTIIDAAITSISSTRATLGALQKNVLETKIRSLQVSSENLTASESRVRDLDMAAEMMNFTKNQILTQASTAMLAQANQAPQSILQLLK